MGCEYPTPRSTLRPATRQTQVCVPWVSIASNAHMKQACPETSLCMLREEYTDMCPELLPTEAMPEKVKAFKAGQLQIMCVNPIYAFYEVGPSQFFFRELQSLHPTVKH